MNPADDDLYGGYHQETMGGYEQMGPPATAAALGPPGSAMRPPGSAFRAPAGGLAPMGAVVPGTGMRMGTGQRLGTGQVGGGEDGRPMTSNQGAGYSSTPPRNRFDPMQGGTVRSSTSMLQKKSESSQEEAFKDLEVKVHVLLEESAQAANSNDVGAALERAKEAGRKERSLCKQREKAGMQEQINVDLTYAVCVNLAQMLHLNKHYTEALNAYGQIVKNKNFPLAGRLRINMGNIYFEQHKYPNSIKMYRMALDQVSNTNKDMRFKIMKNIGIAFVKMGQYQDAMESFQTVMENVPDHSTGFNLIVCFYALGDKEKMKKAFQMLVQVPMYREKDEDEDEDAGDLAADFIDDTLRQFLKSRQSKIQRQILTAARLIAPVIDRNDKAAGFDWAAEQLRKAGLEKESNEVELAKATHYLNNKEFTLAVEVLKEFEKREKDVKARAATNLSFLHFLEGDMDNAEKYAELAVATDRYNARGLVNRGNVMMAKEEYEQALTIYLEAVGVEADCVEAIFNLGLVNKRLGRLEDALVAFKKLNTLLPHNIEVIYQIGAVHDLMGNYKQAIKWLEFLNTLVPHDPGVLAKLGAIHAKYDDEAKALHFYQESHRVYPVNMDVISWLGAFHVKNEVYEKAMPYFDLASKIQPQEVKWALMVASCYRRIGAYPQALAKYKEIHAAHPENVECLRYLVHICTDLGRKDEVHEYVVKLRKAERLAAAETEAARTAIAERAAAEEERDSVTANMPKPRDLPDAGPAYQAPAVNAKKANVQNKVNDDDWGNEELGDDLLPM
mmetsp:Transcript_17885/g.50068  ORF Transcript_17885/g.50068 Transcript_17885/m.50068 type:complete len:786 (+) Transcript_17885:210-2567(+)|eukprot:CAMPEP_0117655046 /NCGR_PEP_ID=MMETSP0804-20121206/4069_1 /TAXON_ID=1074897 /ORGANISM="Tetraselmis astigmatica, Strain CCMP880" /LENGTH=785 /DNA_ID=CAMNT_0005461369 /DNA_START=130 /DNA_END=2487 /DNA_ORIENTATION=-